MILVFGRQLGKLGIISGKNNAVFIFRIDLQFFLACKESCKRCAVGRNVFTKRCRIGLFVLLGSDIELCFCGISQIKHQITRSCIPEVFFVRPHLVDGDHTVDKVLAVDDIQIFAVRKQRRIIFCDDMKGYQRNSVNRCYTIYIPCRKLFYAVACRFSFTAADLHCACALFRVDAVDGSLVGKDHIFFRDISCGVITKIHADIIPFVRNSDIYISILCCGLTCCVFWSIRQLDADSIIVPA